MKFIVLFFFFTGIIFLARAQDDEIGAISTDRPLQCETTTPVPKGHFQSEIGFQYDYTTRYANFIDNRYAIPDTMTLKHTEYSQMNIPNVVLKYGLANRFELRLVLNYRSNSMTFYDFGDSGYYEKKPTYNFQGMESPQLGVKYQFLKEKQGGWWPNLSISAHGYIPMGNGDFSEDRLNLSSRLTGNKTILGSWYVSAGAGGQYYDNILESFIFIGQTGVSLFGKATLALEFYRTLNNTHFNNQYYVTDALDAALIVPIGQNHQIDFSAGTASFGFEDRFAEQAQVGFYNYYVAIGYSFRIRTCNH